MNKHLICTPCWDRSGADVQAVAYAFWEGLCVDHAALLVEAIQRMWASVAIDLAHGVH